MTAVLSYLITGINCFGETDNCMAGQRVKAQKRKIKVTPGCNVQNFKREASKY